MKIKLRKKKPAVKAWRRSPGYWVAVGTLAAYSAAGGKLAVTARGQQTGGWEQAQAPVSRRFDIPAGPVEEAVRAYEAATGLHVVIERKELGNLFSRGVTGNHTQQKALEMLLAGTGISYRFAADGAIVLQLRGPDASVHVTDELSPSSPKYTSPLRDTPQTITIIPRALIAEQGATSLRDVLRNVPGLTIAAGEGGTPAGDNLTLRGFSARNDLFVDGVRDLSPQSRDPFNMEQVEVIKGPASAMSGRGSTGGSINMVSKAPNLRRLIGGGLYFGSDATKRVTADVNAPMKVLGEHTAARLNLLWHEGGVAGRDVVYNRRWGLAPSLAFGLGTPTRLTLSYFKLKQNNISDYGIPWVPATNNALVEYRDQPAPVPRNTFYGFRDRDREYLNSDTATVRFEHDFSDTTNVRSQLRYGRSNRNSMATPPRFASNDSTVINREMRSWIAKDGILDNQTDVRAAFRGLGVEHSLVAGVNLTRENNIRQLRTGANATTTLWNPNPDDVYTLPLTLNPAIGDVTGKTQAVYAFDTVRFSKRWEANAGLRWERFDVNGVNTASAPVNRVDTMNSVRAALIFKPREAGSIYVSYGTSLNPSLEGLSYNTGNTNIEPEKTYTAEVGSKWEVAGGKLLLTGALFRVDKTNARTPGILPDDPPQVLNGRQRVNGVELGATGNLTRRWSLFGGYTFLDSRIVKSNTAAEVGKHIQNAPAHSGNVWTTYRLGKFTAGLGPRYVGRRYGNNSNTRKVPGYWTIDALASYSLSPRVDLRLNLYNANDAYYFDRLGGGHVVPGPARTLAVSTNFRF